jgi:outer membrane protein OmpA-like peptidoglycan-associated protein
MMHVSIQELIMKKVFPAIALGTILLPPVLHAQSVWDRVKQKATDKVNSKTDAAADKAVDAADPTTTKPASTSKPATAAAPADTATPATAAAPASAGTEPVTVTLTAYQNYDFVPGDTILFADDFTTTQDGEFPDQWELVKGQAVVNKAQGYEALLLTDGNYVQVSPRVKTKTYLGPQYTIEYDTFGTAGSYPLMVFLESGDNTAEVKSGFSEAEYNTEGVSLSGNLPAAIQGEKYENHWHHVAIAVKNHQLKVYVDQFRVLTVPDMKFTAEAFKVGGIGDQEHPIVFRNVRVASGGGMNLIGQKFTDAKIVTHGINFDTDKATIRPESMGTINQIKQVLTNNPDLKFEIDGYTDSSGVAAHNLTLSQQRADAVRAELIALGVAPDRLTAKGYGDAKPMADNATPEGKANNRRVEFVKM